METQASRPSRSILWWVYSPYPVIAFLLGAYLLMTRGSYPVIGWISTVMDAVALCGFFGFLSRRAWITRPFWLGFVTLYVIKLAFALALFAYMALAIRWDGSRLSHIVLMELLGLVLGAPCLVAIIRYAFDTRDIWRRRGEVATGSR